MLNIAQACTAAGLGCRFSAQLTLKKFEQPPIATYGNGTTSMNSRTAVFTKSVGGRDRIYNTPAGHFGASRDPLGGCFDING